MHPDHRLPGSPTEDQFANQDHFDDWLDAFVAGPSTPAPTASEPAAPDLTAAQAAARSAARQVHELAQVAATAHASTSSSVSTQWEAILMSHTSTAATTVSTQVSSAPLPIGTKPRTRTRRMETINRIISIAAVLAIFIAGFATAWVARDRFGSEPSMLQLAASPTSTTTCTTRTLSQEDVDRIVTKYKPLIQYNLDALTPTNKPVPEADVIAAIATYRAAQSCPFGDPGADMRWLRSTETEGVLAIRNLAQSPAWNVEQFTTYKTIVEPLSRMLVPPPSSAYIVDSNDPAIKPYLVNVIGTGTFALLPSTFVQFPDGSIGAPFIRATPGGAASGKDYSQLNVSFVAFAYVDGRWLITGGLDWLCPEDCTASQYHLDGLISSYRSLETEAATPTPEAADSWLQPVSASECVPVSASATHDIDRPRAYAVDATPAPDGDAVARQSRALTACTPRMPPTENPLGIVSQFETTRAQQEAASEAPLSPEQIALAQQLSTSYATDGYQIVQRAPEGIDVVNSPSAFSTDFSGQMFVSALVFQPDESISLADGRVAIPTTYLVSDDASWDFAQQQPYQWTTLTIWVKVDDTWLIDERLPLCIGDCTNFWQNQATHGSPLFSPIDPFTVLYTVPTGTPSSQATPKP